MPIKIYTDESVPVAVAAGLQRRSMDAISARDISNLGLTDVQQLKYAVDNGYVLLTHDTDFIALGHAHTARGEHHPGIVYVHQYKLSIGEIIRRTKEIVDLISADESRDHIEFLWLGFLQPYSSPLDFAAIQLSL